MGFKTVLLVMIGFIALTMGAIGLFLPIWPTTPFVLLAAGCFSGTPRLRKQLLRIRFFREYIENYSLRQGLSRKTVVMSLLYLWGMLLFSMIMIQKLTMVIVLATIGTAVTFHILYMSRAKDKEEKGENI